MGLNPAPKRNIAPLNGINRLGFLLRDQNSLLVCQQSESLMLNVAYLEESLMDYC